MRPRTLAWIAALAAAVLAGYALARLALASGQHAHARARSTRARPAATAKPSGARSPATMAARPSVHAALGAAATAVSYLRALEPAPASASRQALLRALTLPPLTNQALQAQATGAAVWQRLSARGPVLMRGWTLGYRVDSYTRSRARVTVWTMGLVASATEVVAPQWSTTVCELRFTDRAWRVAAAEATSGPTPPQAPSSPVAVASFARAAAAFRRFDAAP
jgi:hypothetical protein